MVNNVIHSFTSVMSYIPFSGRQLQTTATFVGGIAAATIAQNYSSWFGWTAGLASLALYATSQVKTNIKQKEQDQEFVKKILDWMRTCINSPLNKYTPEAREQMLTVLTEIEKNSVIIQTGNDDLRVPLVGCQQITEHVLSALQITNGSLFIGVIHTAMPPTPFCAQRDEAKIKELLHPSIQHDPDKLTTVGERIVSLLRLLKHPNTKLYPVYPQPGLFKRKLEEQQTYSETVKAHPNTLIDYPLNCETIDPTKNGATYLITDEKGRAFAFSIRAQQAINPQEESVWGMWFGSIEQEQVGQRVRDISSYLTQHNGPNFLYEFSQSCLTRLRG